jgi:hypothetical protein
MITPNLQITCNINTTDPDVRLGLEIYLDKQIILDVDHVQELINFSHTINDTDGKHCLEFVMKNETIEDTKIDNEGRIIKDACLTIEDLAFDEIKLNQIFIDHAVYTHDFNGTKESIQTKFYKTMGCNGSVQLDFNTPIYLWLLEHM